MMKAFYCRLAVILCVGMLIGFSAQLLADEGLVRERNVSLREVPEAVRTTILQAAGGKKIEEIEEVTQGKRKFYEAEWQAGDVEVEVRVAPDGRLLLRLEEREVSINEIPFAARQAIENRAGGNRIEEVEEISIGSRKFYEAEWHVNGKEVEIRVDDLGRLQGKMKEEKEDDDREDDDKDDDDKEHDDT